MLKSTCFKLAIFGALVGFGAGSAQAAVIPVAPGLKTLSAAITAANSSDTLELSTGTYDEGVVTFPKPLTVRAAAGQHPVVNITLANLAPNNGAFLFQIQSVAGLVTYTSYGAAKAWAIRFSQALSAQLAGTGVQALALCPGLVHTEFHVRGNVDAAGAPAFMWLGVERVVDECLRDLRRGKTISIPSKRYRVLVGAGRFVPSGFAARVARNRSLRRKKS